MNTPDCYFFVDTNVPASDQKISALCVSCHDEKMPDIGWFYKGSVEGYGPFTYKCNLCGSIIYSEDDNVDKVDLDE